ncbi:zinc ABC transporter substrate-binding protein [Pseudomonas sp. RIT-PI-S]|uniref:zinc ABC transporter substrate-binding protein n=1 Tax=Pseudomonas sp. RIT-PI-S TaxID=3035295 RepID=UPI0021DAAE7C|nr:zinc ABC transporter substrate-binding protein [Pseudomonas sp. RIT-PI-S]
METLLCYLFLLPKVPTVSRLFLWFVCSAFGLGLSPLACAQLKVLTSIKPLQLIAAAVQDGTGIPDVLLPPGASPHNYALRPSEVRRVAEADLLYWIGPDLEGFMQRPLALRKLPSVAVQALPGLHLRRFSEDSQSHDEDTDEHDHDHRPGSLDAHLWLDPANARVIAEKMAADFAQADPANAARYQQNLVSFKQRLEQLDASIRQRLSGVAGKPFFVFHEGFDYFEQAYGLKHAGVFTVGAEVQPGAAHVAAMRARLSEAGKSCVFSEPPARPRLAETLTAGLPVRLAELDALGGFDEPSPQGYEHLLQRLADSLAGCLEEI